MAVKTSNAYGKITIDDDAIAMVTGHIARECYGVIDLSGQGFVGSFSSLKKKSLSNGVKIKTLENRIYIDVDVILKFVNSLVIFK